MTDSTTPGGGEDLGDRLRRALPSAMKARDRLAVTALRSALAAIDNAGAVDATQAPRGTGHPEPGDAEAGHPQFGGTEAGHRDLGGQEAGHSEPAGMEAGHPEFAGTVAGLGAAEVERCSLTPAQVERIVRAEVTDREAAAVDYERAGQLEHADRLRAEAKVLSTYLDAT
jgi:uncharacterized protein YqeY